MITSNRWFLGMLAVLMVSGCATQNTPYYDSAGNDRNPPPKNFSIPQRFDRDDSVVDKAHTQSEADFLFLKSDLESQAGKSNESIEGLKAALVYDATSATLMQRLAVEYYKKGQTKEAIAWAESALKAAPQSREIKLLVGGLYTTTKNFEKAEQIYLALLKKDKNDDEAQLYLGAVYSEMKQYKKSLQCFKNLTTRADYASKHMAHYYLARVMLEQNAKGSYEKAEVELRRALESKPDFFEAVSLLGQLIQKRSGLAKAYAFYEEQQKRHGPQAKLAELLSQYYIEKNQYDKAYEQLEIIDASADDLVQVKLKMALILIDKKMYDPAIVKLQEILSFAPESDKVRFYLAAVYEEKKEFPSAFSEYMKIVKTSSFYEDSRLHAGYLAKLMGNSEQAIAVLKESLTAKTENPQNYFLLAQLYEDQREYKKSLEVLMTAEKKYPKNPQVYFYIGSIQDKMNLKKDMITSMKKVLELDQEHVQAMNYLAFSWAEMNQELDNAEKLARLAATKEKNDAFILDTLGWVLYKKGQYKEAMAVLEKAHDIQPTVGIISEHLGDVYTKQQKYDKARELFLKASEAETDESRKKDLFVKLSDIETRLKTAPVRQPASNDLSVGPEPSP